MLRIIISLVGVLAIDGCAFEYCEPPEQVTFSSDTRPGTVRAAAAFRAFTSGVAALSDGRVVCLTCTGPVILDGELHRKMGIPDIAADVVVGPDDTIYAAVGGQERSGYGSDTVAAYTPGGARRWRHDLEFDVGDVRSIIPTSDAIYVSGDSSTVALDPVSSVRRMFAPSLLLAAGPASVFTIDSRAYASSPTVRRFDPAGTMLWTRTWTSWTAGNAVGTSDGGVIVIGSASAAVDFGDRTLEASNRDSDFLVAIDAAGATQWAFRLPGMAASRIALAPNGDILLSGRRVGDSLDGHDSFLAVATPAGISRSHDIAGPADQDIEGMSVSPDGVVWLVVSNLSDERQPDAVLKVGGHSFEDSSYVIGIVP